MYDDGILSPPDAGLARYQVEQTYLWNYQHAPSAPPDITVPAMAGTWTYCGKRVPSPLAVAAGPLLNGGWVLYYAALGFDILTYKTTRSQHRDCYPLPNLQPVVARELSVGGTQLAASERMAADWAISFGMPSMSPEIWRADVEWTRSRLPKDKLLSVSVVATVGPENTEDEMADDFAQCARWAVDSGADCVEANFSCPNVSSLDGQLYQRPTVAGVVAERIKQSVGSTPLMIKIGYIEEESLAEELLDSVAPFADALAMTNCISATVRDSLGQPMFGGQSRGIGGNSIRAASARQVALLTRLIRSRGLRTRIIGCGGISQAAHVREYLDAGAEAVQIATAAMLNPLVARQIRHDW